MDVIIDGKKGSGKTYYAVNFINDLKDKTKILTNIKGLNLGKNIYKLAKEWKLKPIDFFRDSFHDEESEFYDERFSIFHGYTFVLDEAQKLFPKPFKDQDMLQFFQMSRHYDIDVILITQDISLMCYAIALHPEYNLRATPSTSNPVPGFFVYRKMQGKELIGPPILVKKKKEVFDLYKSTDTGDLETRKRNRPMIKLLLISIIAIIIIATLFHFIIKSKNHKEDDSNSEERRNEFIKRQSNKMFNRGENRYQQGLSNKRPQSLAQKQGGQLIKISSIKDKKGMFLIMLNVLYPQKLFPYPVFDTPGGLYALVPEDVAEYYDTIREKQLAFNLSGYDPNSKYINNNQYQNNTNSSNNYTSSD